MADLAPANANSMSASEPTPARELVIVGLHPVDADDLTEVLAYAAPGRFAVRCLPVSLAELDPGDADGRVVLAGAAGLPRGVSVREAARDLRLERCIWAPVHLLLRGRLAGAPEWDAWGIRPHSLPVDDVEHFAEALLAGTELPPRRRLDVVRGLLTATADDLSALRRALEPNRPVEPERARAALGEAIAVLSEHGQASARCAEALKRLRERPLLEDADLGSALPLLHEAERQARTAGVERLAAALHRVTGTLRLARWRPEAVADVFDRLLRRLAVVLERAVPELPDETGNRLRAVVTHVLPSIQAARGNEDSVTLSDASFRAAEEISEVLRALEPPPLSGAAGAMIRRVVVVEDDPDWQREIAALIQDLHLRLPVQTAATLREATRLLKQAEPALVLVDLGLPDEPEGDVTLDAGLVLIRQFTGSDSRGEQFPHRFLILTGAEARAEAVRRAVALGVSPSGYLRKDPETWQTQLRLQVRVALQPPSDRPPLVEVFQRTGRIARVEGYEITLPYPTWCLLAAFAERPAAWRQTSWLAEVLAREPYHLDPGTDDLDDPEERIERQLPHYASDLRALLAEAYRHVHHRPPPRNLLEADEFHRYRLHALVRSLGRVEEYYAGMVPARRPAVLVVEDDPTWAQAITGKLQQSGFETRWAASSDAARRLAAESPPDLVSLDLELPAGADTNQASSANGIALLEHLRQEFPGLPVAVLTSIADRDQEMLRILPQGVRVDDYLSKGDADALPHLAGSLARLWQERLTGTNILDWNPLAPVYPLRIDPQGPLLTHVAGYPIQVPRGGARTVLRVLSQNPNVFVSRTELIEAVYPDPEHSPDDPEDGLKAITRRLRRVIDAATLNRETGLPAVPGDHVICGERGVLWLRGLVQ